MFQRCRCSSVCSTGFYNQIMKHGGLLLLGFVLAAAAVPHLLWGDTAGSEFCRKNYDGYKARILKNANDADAWMELRVCTTELKRWNDAAALASTVLKSNPEQADAHLIL